MNCKIEGGYFMAKSANSGAKKYRKDYIELAILYIIIAILTLTFVVPFIWLFLSSFKTSSDLFRNPPKWLPETWTLENYVQGFTGFPFFKYLKNTLIIIAFNIVGGLISNSVVAYGFSRIKWKGRNAIFYIVLMTMILPFQTTMIPLFLLFQKLGWIGTFLPLVVPAFFGNAFFIFLMRQFLVGIPFEISESAKVDGASEFMIYWRIIMPLSKPVLLTVAIFTFMNCWNDFVGPLVFLTDNNLYTLSIGVQQLMSANDPRWPLLIAVGVAMTTPVLIIFFALQRHFIEGISFSGLKG